MAHAVADKARVFGGWDHALAAAPSGNRSQCRHAQASALTAARCESTGHPHPAKPTPSTGLLINEEDNEESTRD